MSDFEYHARTPTLVSPASRLRRKSKNSMGVMLSAAKHPAVSVTYEDEILRLLPQDDIKTQSSLKSA